MKKLLLLLLPGMAFSQNLKPDNATAIAYDVMPTQEIYVNMRKICVQGLLSNDQNYISYIESDINRRIYTLVTSKAESDLTFIVHGTIQNVNAPQVTSKTETKKKSDGTTYNVTTWTATQQSKLTATVDLVTPDGVKVATKSFPKTIDSQGSGTSSQAAQNELATNRMNSQTSGMQDIILMAFHNLESDYLIDDRKLEPFTMPIKSRKQDYSDMNKVAELLQAWYKEGSYAADSPQLVEAMSLNEAALAEHAPDDKKSRIDNEVAAVCYYNKAYALFAQKKYAEANAAILKSEELDKRIHWSQERLKDQLADMQKRKMY